MKQAESSRNIRLGILLFITAVIMFALAFAWAMIYNGFV
jgi:hypothetical protein